MLPGVAGVQFSLMRVARGGLELALVIVSNDVLPLGLFFF